MLKLEIKLDEEKVIKDRIYQVDSIYETLNSIFEKHHLPNEKLSDGTMFFYGTGEPKDYGAFGSIITSLKDKVWFMNYVTRWIWYNSDDGVNENDFAVEDVLYHYTKRRSQSGEPSQDDNGLMRKLDEGIDDMEAGRELPLEEAFEKITELRENTRKEY